MKKSASVVVDLGFGDAGKGVLTDFLVRELGAHTVVRFNGGAQAGHNVVTPDGRHHTFAQIGSGAFVPGVRTFLSRFMVVHPTALLVEAARLAARGVDDALERTEVSGDALVTTPFHQAACQLRELARGGGAHGSCGIGVGETVMDSLTPGADVVRMRDLDRAAIVRTLARIQERKREELADAVRAFPSHAGALTDPQIVNAWIHALAALRSRITVADDDRLDSLLRTGAVVFEGAQGVLLDEWRGFHPHTTWSTCTPENALALIGDRYDGETTVYGVLRTYATRHGAGPFPSEDRTLECVLSDPNNVTGPWQGALRFGHLDATLLRYAIEACGRVDALALTHLDALEQMSSWRACDGYRANDRALFDHEGDRTVRLRLGPSRDLDHQERITRALERAIPIERDLDRNEPVAEVEALLDRPVHITAAGPSSRDVRRIAQG